MRQGKMSYRTRSRTRCAWQYVKTKFCRHIVASDCHYCFAIIEFVSQSSFFPTEMPHNSIASLKRIVWRFWFLYCNLSICFHFQTGHDSTNNIIFVNNWLSILKIINIRNCWSDQYDVHLPQTIKHLCTFLRVFRKVVVWTDFIAILPKNCSTINARKIASLE